MQYKMEKLIFIIPFALFFACNTVNKEQQQAVDSLRSEVMTIHDDAMFYMQDIENLKQALLDVKDSVASEDSIIAENVSNQLDPIILQLEEADEAMMTWMREYTPRYTEIKEAGNLDSLQYFLEYEKTKITKVKEVMESAMLRAEEALNND